MGRKGKRDSRIGKYSLVAGVPRDHLRVILIKFKCIQSRWLDFSLATFSCMGAGMVWGRKKFNQVRDFCQASTKPGGQVKWKYVQGNEYHHLSWALTSENRGGQGVEMQ